MQVVLLVAAAAILGGVIVVALGRGGELASFAADVPPFQADIVTAADVALIRPPSALFGYNSQVTDDVLSAIARTVTDRDVEIASLRQRLADLQEQAEPRPLHLRRGSAVPTASGAVPPARSGMPPDGSAVPPARSVVPPGGSAVPPARNAAAGRNAALGRGAAPGRSSAGRSSAPGRGAAPPGDWSAWQPATPGQPGPPAPGPASRAGTDPGDPPGGTEPGGPGAPGE